MVVCGVAGGVGTTSIAALMATAAPWLEADAHTTLIDVRGDVGDLLIGGPCPRGLADLEADASLSTIEDSMVYATMHTKEPLPSVRILPRGNAAHDWMPGAGLVAHVVEQVTGRGHTVVIDAGTAQEAVRSGLAGGALDEAVVLVTGDAAVHSAELASAAQIVDASTVVVVADREGLRSWDAAPAGVRYVTRFLRDPETAAWLERRGGPPPPRHSWTVMVDASQVCAYADWEQRRRRKTRTAPARNGVEL